MNLKNLEFLKEGLKYLGFGDKLNSDLENKINQQPAEFKLHTTGEFKGSTDQLAYTLDFKKSEQTDMYFLNRYQATLKNEDPEKEKTQTFYINKNSGITAKESYNLLSGRAVHKELNNKEGEAYKAWLQLDFKEKDNNDNFKVKQYHQNYGYELEPVLNRYPIKELTNAEDKTKLIKSLEKGNLHAVTFTEEGKDSKVFIEANPQYKSLNLYDSKMQPIFQGIEKREKQGSEKSNDKKESAKKETDDEDGTKQKRQRSIRA